MEIQDSAQDAEAHSRSCVAANRRIITVHASSEIACKPDSYSLEISVISTKPTAESAQSSIKRRSEYILQVLRKNNIKEKRVEKSTSLNRIGEDEVCVQVHFLVQSDSLSTCESVRNVLIEKMDATVRCSEIEQHHSPAHKAAKRQEAFTQAVCNAKDKALSVAQMLQVSLGPVIKVIEKTSGINPMTLQESQNELSCNSVTIPSSDTHTPLQSPTVSLCHSNRALTLIYSSEIQVTFEAVPLRICSHHKCLKHK